jgi:hypothetical protein
MYVMRKSFPIVVHNDYQMAFGESGGRIFVFLFFLGIYSYIT